MPRKPRKQSYLGIYHVMIRGINKQNVFLDADDYLTMMRVLAEARFRKNNVGITLSEHECSILAFAILPNHVHILIKEEEKTLSEIMKKIEDRYVYFYNKKYDRCGHLFQDRFKSEPVEDEEYLWQLMRYIHRNPVKAMLCKHPADYIYSSWNEYIDGKRNAIMEVCNTSYILDKMEEKKLVEWTEEDVDDKCMDMDSLRFVVTDKHAWDMISEISGVENAEDFKQLDTEVQMKIVMEAISRGITIRQASRLSIFSYNKIRKAWQAGKGEESMRKTNRGVRPLDSVFESIRENEGLNLNGLSEMTGISVYGCRKLLQSLEKQGKITHRGSGRNWEWFVIDTAPNAVVNPE